jgi:Holliday junction resolvasome RuvABC endonuclease subunit
MDTARYQNGFLMEETIYETTLVVDPAIITGWALLKIYDCGADCYRGEICEYGYVTIPEESEETDGDRCNWVFDWTGEMIEKHAVTHVVEEEFFFSKRFATGSPVNVMLRAAIQMSVRKKGLQYTKVSPSLWKSFVAGRSTPTKEQVKLWGKLSAKKLFVQKALWDNYGFRFPDHSLSKPSPKNKKQRPVKLNMDQVDAVGIAVFYCCCINRIQEITLTVLAPPDVGMALKPRVKLFVYPQ